MASCVALLVIMSCQITVVPSLLLLFPTFFSANNSARTSVCPAFCPAWLVRWWTQSGDDEEEDVRMRRSLWFRLGNVITVSHANIGSLEA